MTGTGARRLLRSRKGQATVEFGLVAPLFFFLLFSVVNGGIFLASRGAIQHAADVGAAEIAAEGQSANGNGPTSCGTSVDQVAICEMDAAGLNNTILTQVYAVTVQEMVPSGSSGTLVVAPSTCGGSGNEPCMDEYSSTGTVMEDYWPPSDRDVTEGGGGPNYAELSVIYTFTAVGNFVTLGRNPSGFPPTGGLRATVIFRLEPQIL